MSRAPKSPLAPSTDVGASGDNKLKAPADLGASTTDCAAASLVSPDKPAPEGLLGEALTPSQLASMLGRLAAGRPKRYSRAELKRRTERLHRANKARLLALKQRKEPRK